MARLKAFKELRKERNSLHEPAECTYTIFSDDGGNQILQIDSYGTSHRKLAGKVSQSIQVDKQAARTLRDLIDRVFPD